VWPSAIWAPHYSKKVADEAMAHFRRALDIDPDYREAHVDSATHCSTRGKRTRRCVHYRHVWRSTRGNANNAALGLGNALLATGRSDDAILRLSAGVISAPDRELAHNNLGNALLRNGQVEEAAEQYRSALAVDASFALAHNQPRQRVDANAGRYGRAMRHYRRALELDPSYAEAHYNLGIALFQGGGVDEAIRHSTRAALALRPGMPRHTTTWASPISVREGGRCHRRIPQRARERPAIRRRRSTTWRGRWRRIRTRRTRRPAEQ
jgi:tetratricopeptide (TPR) repeat protein